MAKKRRKNRGGNSNQHPLYFNTAVLPPGVKFVEVQGNQYDGGNRSEVGLVAGAGRTYRTFVACTNSTCRGGGYDLEPAILEVIRSRKTEVKKQVFCTGTEPVHRRCGNHIEMNVKVFYENAEGSDG